MVCTVDWRATDAGVAMLRSGGSAADAALDANAVLAVTCPHLCGMGGDLWAIVHEPGREPRVLNATGRAGSGVDPDALRARGLAQMPLRGDPVSVTVPGCVDGWEALAAAYGRLALDEVLAPAIGVAEDGFAAGELLAAAAVLVDDLAVDEIGTGLREGDTVRRSRAAGALRAIVRDGRDGFYLGAFGRGLLAVGGGVYSEPDLERSPADWVAPAALDVFERRLWTAPPSSQGYLIPAILHVADTLGLPDDESDPEWLRILVGGALGTGADRPTLLHEHADARELLGEANLARWTERTRRWPEGSTTLSTTAGDTTYLCTIDEDGMAVSLIQSNAMDFGSHLAEPETGTFLHNRGVGFSLEPGHPAELGPGRRPPSTLSPVMITDTEGKLVAVAGTMGGDSQPQLMAQHLVRLLRGAVDPAALLDEPRWMLAREGDRGFDLWPSDGGSGVCRLVTDPDGLARWGAAAATLGFGVDPTAQPWSSAGFGHAHLIARTDDGWIGAAEPRVPERAAAAV